MSRLPYSWSARAAITSARLNNGPHGFYDMPQNSSQSAITTSGSHAISGATTSIEVYTNRVIGIYGSMTVTNSGSACRYTVEVLEGGTALVFGGRIGDVTSPGSGDIAFISGWAFDQVATHQTNTYSLQLTIQSGSAYSLTIATSTPAAATIAAFDMGGLV